MSVDGQVPRTGSLRTASDPGGSSAKQSLPGAAGRPGPSKRSNAPARPSLQTEGARPGSPSKPSVRVPDDFDRSLRAAARVVPAKYRPQGFDDVVGQEPVVRTLRNAVSAGNVRQAYLFAGPRGTGKTSLARILAKALNCAHGPTPGPGRDVPRLRRDRGRNLARRRRDGRGLTARHRRHPRDPRARRPAAGRGPLQGLHPRRGAPAHGRRLQRAPEADRGASAPPRLRVLHDRAAEDAVAPSGRAARRSSSRGRGCRRSSAT